MRQVLHILRKDARHHWPEIVISLALTAAYGRFEVRSWDTPGAQSVGLAFLFEGRFWTGLAQVLTPVIWCFLVIRIIHDESLVGDRQFWVTRPYEWRKLLSSKAMFTLLFVCAPLLTLQCYLLASAGFHPAKYVAGLLWMQLLMALFVLVPTAALATLTATLAQWLLALLLVALYFVGMNWLSSWQRNSFSVPDVTDHLDWYLFVVVCAAVILLQYARRATVKSRLLVGSFGCVVALAPLMSPHEYFLAKAYPALQAGAPPFQLELLPAENAAKEPVGEAEKEVSLRLPLKVTGVPPDAIVNMDGGLVTIDGPDGQHWDAGWKSIGAQVFPETTEVRVAFVVGRAEFLRMRRASVTVHLAVAYKLFREGERKSFVIPNGRFELEGMGWCSPGYFMQIRCLIPMREPSSLLITSVLSKRTCPLLGQEKPFSDELARGWIRRGDSAPADFGISPVTAKDLYLSHADGRAYSGISLCPGTPVTLSHPQEIGASRTTIELGEVKLGEYRQDGGWR